MIAEGVETECEARFLTERAPRLLCKGIYSLILFPLKSGWRLLVPGSTDQSKLSFLRILALSHIVAWKSSLNRRRPCLLDV